jgi:hypothetical protein
LREDEAGWPVTWGRGCSWALTQPQVRLSGSLWCFFGIGVLYCILNEQNKSIAELWDGENLKCTFQRFVDRRLFLMWEKLINLISTIEFDGEEDALVWQFQSSGFIPLTLCMP